MVHEANGISSEMAKGCKFSVKLVSKALDEFEGGDSGYRTSVCVVVVRDQRGRGGGIGEDEMWSHNKFHNRIYIMREMYHTYKDAGSLKGTEFEGEEGDPFYDPPQDYMLGVARLQLEAISYLLDVDEATPVVDYKGQSFGEALISMFPAFEGDHEDIEALIGSPLTLTITVKR